MPARRRIIGLSLKMYMGVAETRDWMRRLAVMAQAGLPDDVDLFVVPSFLSLQDANEILRGTGVRFGAQDVFWEQSGPYTGEVSAPMLAEVGCRFVEIGHAERRRLFGETDAMIAAKARSVVRAGLVPVLCIGEHDRTTQAAAVDACWSQFEAATEGVDREAELVVAWEPVWAIGAVEPASSDYIVATGEALRDRLKAWPSARLIYGGSAGPGLLGRLGGSVDGLFLGRFGHGMEALRQVLGEASTTRSLPT